MQQQPWHPGSLLETSGFYWKSCALHAGVKLDLFSVIGDQKRAAEDVARETQTDIRALKMLLNALAAMALLEKKGDYYENSTAARNFLCKQAPGYIGYMIRHHHHLVPSWAQLDQAVLSGRPVRGRSSQDEDDRRASFLMGMFNLAMNLAPQIIPAVDLTGRRHLLDLGGGPGTYAIHFCQTYPGLKASVCDLATTRPFAEKTIARFELSDRIAFHDFDFLRDVFSERYDVAWLSHILHAESPEGCERVLQKTVQALEPGGMIIIHEFILDDTLDQPLFPALFALNMLLGTSGGQAYSEAELTRMLAKAGARNIERIRLEVPNDSGLMVAVV